MIATSGAGCGSDAGVTAADRGDHHCRLGLFAAGVQTIIGLEDYSMFWAYIAMPVGGLFAVLGIVGNFSTRSGSSSKPHNRTRTPCLPMLITMVLCFALTISVAVSIGLAAVFGIYIGNVNMLVSVKEMFSINKFLLAAIPFFIPRR